MKNFEPKKRRASAIPIKIPFLHKLFFTNLLTVDRIELLVKKPYEVFLSYKKSEDDKSITIFIYYYDFLCKQFKENVIKKSADNWFFAFKELLTFIAQLSKKYTIKKKEFFKKTLKHLKDMKVKKGYFNSCDLELKKYVNKLQIFTFKINPIFYEKIVIVLAYFKKNKKSEKYNIKIDNLGNYTVISNTYFFMRDLSRFFDLNQSSDSPESLISTMLIDNGHNNNNISHMTFLNKLATFYRYFNLWTSSNYFGLNFTFNAYTSISLLSYHFSSQEKIKNNPLEMSLFRLSLSDLELFSSHNSGGLIYRCLTHLSSGDELRPEFGHCNPAKNILSYDIRSAYGHAFLNSDIPCGNSNHYLINPIDQKLHLKRDMFMFPNERNAVYAILYGIIIQPIKQ